MKMPPTRVKQAKDLFTGNIRLKLLSLLLAIFIWSFLAFSREIRYDLTLPLELRNIPVGYSLAAKPPRGINFTLSGPSIMVEAARRSNSTVILTLRGASVPGRTTFSALEKTLKLPEGVKVIRTSPSLLTLDLIRTPIQQPEGDQ
jgi:hypothetical protein